MCWTRVLPVLPFRSSSRAEVSYTQICLLGILGGFVDISAQ
jgi:hypothetical protein